MNRFSEYFTAEEIAFLQSRMLQYDRLFDHSNDPVAVALMAEIRDAKAEELDKPSEGYKFDL